MISVLPSDLEGLSLALLDAMGAGLCVLASDVPENREAVDYVGFTLPRGDVACLTDRLQFLIAIPWCERGGSSGETADSRSFIRGARLPRTSLFRDGGREFRRTGGQEAERAPGSAGKKFATGGRINSL